MGKPESGPGEVKDKAYFIAKLTEIYNESLSNGDPQVARVLSVLIGSMHMKNVNELADLCSNFSKKMLAQIDAKQNIPKN